MNFKITYFKLVNHVVLGDKECHLDNDIVSIMGRNGSGKSFLIDTLHPYAKSSRFVSSYPFKKGEVGYKQVDFTMPDGTVYETIHEFTPKNKTHACKSYLNKIVNGFKYELNPTGHCDKYDELITKHLNANPAILDVGFISFKSNGITGSKGVDRKKVLETTIDSEVLKSYKKNCRQHLTEHNVFAKQYESRKLKLASMYTETSLDKEIHETLTKKSSYENQLKECHTKMIDLEKQYKEYESLKNVDEELIDLLYKACNIMKENDEFKGMDVKTFVMAIQGYNHALSKKVSDRKDCDTVINLKKHLQESTDDLNNVQNSLNEYKSNYNTHKNNLSDYINTEHSKDNVLSWLRDCSYYANEFTRRLNDTNTVVTTQSALNQIIDDLVKEKSIIDRFIAKYDLAAESTNGESYVVEHHSVCDTCQLYDKFVNSTKFILENELKYKKVINVELPDNIDRTNNLTKVRDMVVNNMTKTIEGINTYLTEKSISRLGIKDIDTFLAGCSNGKLVKQLQDLETWTIDKYNILESLNSNIIDNHNKVETLKVKVSECERLMDGLISPEIAEQEYDRITKEIEKIVEILSNGATEIVSDIQNYRNTYGSDAYLKYSGKTPEELTTIYNNIHNLDNACKKVKSELDNVNSIVSELPNKIQECNYKIFSLEHKKQELKEINEKLLDYDSKRKILARCKDILEKDIPLALLQNNLKFIEEATNTMLSSNDINMSCEIVSTDSEIIIPITMGTKEIQDATQLSSGEACIMSLLLNACVLHIMGYPIICLDEIDANLDTIMKGKFNDLVYTIMNVLNVSQVICISHNVSSNINFSTKLLLGSGEGLEVAENDTNIIKL